MLCGTEPFPELYRAKKYKIQQKYLTKAEFQFIMKNLPVKVAELDKKSIIKIKSNLLKGSATGSSKSRPEHDGTGGDRHDQHHRQERARLLPGVLCRGP